MPRDIRGILLTGASKTLRVAARLAARAKGGETICLYGALGSGKTTFARGFLRALGVRGAVRSPTFALIHEYRRVKPQVIHMDFYRLKPNELDNIGFRDHLEDPSAVCLIEWPEAAEGLLPADRLEIRLDHGAQVVLRSRSPRGAKARREDGAQVVLRSRTMRLRAFGRKSSALLRGAL
ncbi:MAG: tRNA (adenosine(37)-N6)-threonylcarbamoyltransferase complex ATPase subunit type 1 TsaE [Elusimicrobia bacterium]|nr:tRNA (adenosine(37)-N6)-threonylcarbamoyltransferase complex ATPase subunit type 1 TsaE [Elusimicrobiota bacterium]